MKLGTILVCILCFACGGAAVMMMSETNASTVFIGKTTPPGQLEVCLAVVAAMQDLGTNPDNPTLLAGLDDLDSETASVLQFEETTVPANICTLGGQCANIGAITCARRGLGLNRSLIRHGACLAECSDLSLPVEEQITDYWVGFPCP